MENNYIVVDGKKMRRGYTTGSCATAATKAGAIMLVMQKPLENICIITPNGTELNLKINNIDIKSDSVTCSITKDSGDDPDITNGIEIFATVTYNENFEFSVIGGEGVGIVTKAGLNQSVGQHAINSTPRLTITNALKEVADDYNLTQGLISKISVPKGEEIAQKTFNPRLGIVGGISILGTSGIVEPMSEKALIDTIKSVVNVQKSEGRKTLLITPGNYGKDYLKLNYEFKDETSIKISNYVGESLDYIAEQGFEKVLLVGHAGKLFKLAGGLFNTHSKYGDCRAEIVCASAVKCGVGLDTLSKILDSVTVDEMLLQIEDIDKRKAVVNRIVDRMYDNLNRRTFGKVKVEFIVFTQKLGFLGESPFARDFANQIYRWEQEHIQANKQ